MTPESTTRQREIVVIATLTTLVGAGLYFYLVLIGGWLVPLMLGVVTLLFLFGAAHYLLWGRALEVRTQQQLRRETPKPRRAGYPTISLDRDVPEINPGTASENGTTPQTP